MGYAPDAWGPTVWDALHLLCYTAPETIDVPTQLRYTAFFQSLPFILPCAACSEHLQEHYKAVPIEGAVGSRKALFEWSVALHNAVNIQLGKPVFPVKDAWALWEKRLGGSSPNAAEESLVRTTGSKWVYGVLGIAVLVGAISVMVLVYRKKIKK
jgi:Erv1 / Alr family